MKVEFYKGVIRKKTGQELGISWAKTPLGVLAFVRPEEDFAHCFDPKEVGRSDLIVTLDLPDLDEESVRIICSNVLEGGYLERPGLRNKGDALLFVLVNEALHRLAEIAAEEELE